MKVEGNQQRRYALLQATRDCNEKLKEAYGGDCFNLYVATYGEEGDRWDLFRVVDGEFPDMNNLINYDGFVITGSSFSAYENHPWIIKLCSLLQTLDSMGKKILGICFGHQVLCRALGGNVGKSHSSWDIGIKKVMINKDLFPHSFLDPKEEIPSSLYIHQCHQDDVLEVPPGATVVAISEKTRTEMFTIGNHILGIQGHPEYPDEILYLIIDMLLKNGSIEKGFAENAKLELQIAEPADRKYWEKICKNFLKR